MLLIPLTNPVANFAKPMVSHSSHHDWTPDSSLSIRCFNSHVLHKVISGHPFGTATRIGHGDEEGRQQNACSFPKTTLTTWCPKVDTKKNT